MPELGNGSKHVAVEICRTGEVEDEHAHSAAGEPLGKRQPGANVAMELVGEDDAVRAAADDDAVEVGPGTAEVDDLRRRILARAKVERLPRGFGGRRSRAHLSLPSRSAT